MTLMIRDARRDERRSICELTLRAYEQYARLMAPEAWTGLREAVISGLAMASDADRIVAEKDDTLVGSVLLYPPGITAYTAETAEVSAWPELRLLAVPPEWRGHGVARALVAECIRRASEQDAPYLGLHTSRSMAAAQGLYSTMGFVRAPELDFSTDGSELVEGYKLRLSPARGAPDRP